MLKLLMTLALVGSQDLTLPTELRVKPSEFIILTASTTKSDVVKFVPLDAGLVVLKSNLLKDQKTFVATAKPGTYKVLAYTAFDNKPSDPVFTTIKVGEDDVVPNPDEWQKILDAVYGADADPNKAESKNKMVAGFKELLANSDNINNVSDLNAAVKKFVGSKLKAGEASALRSVLSDKLKAEFGITPDKSLDSAKVKAVLSQIIKSLEALQ